MANYTLTELMAVAAAREIADGEVVFAGTGLPMLGAMLAQRTHAPGCCIVFEAGTMASQLAHLPMSVGDPRVVRGAAMVAGLSEVFSYVLQAGRVDVGFLSGAQIDRFGNINSTSIGADPCHPQVRFPGSGGSCDIACLARRTVIIAIHERRRFPERIDYITSPGWLTGADSRRKAGLIRGGPSVGGHNQRGPALSFGYAHDGSGFISSRAHTPGCRRRYGLCPGLCECDRDTGAHGRRVAHLA